MRRSTRLNVEALEAREVPATFGAGSGCSVAYGDIIPVELDNGQAEYITGTGPGRDRDARARLGQHWRARQRDHTISPGTRAAYSSRQAT